MDTRDSSHIEAVVYEQLADATNLDASLWRAQAGRCLRDVLEEFGLDSLAVIDLDWRVERALHLPSVSLPEEASEGTVGQLVAWYVGRATSDRPAPPWPWPKPKLESPEVF